MDAQEFFVILFLVSTLAGGLGSILGLGGGIIIVPILTSGLGVPPLFAIGASIVSVIATSSSSAAAYVKEGIVNVRIGTFLALATTSGAVIGAVSTLALAEANLTGVIYFIFGVALLFSVVPLLRRLGEELPERSESDGISRRLDLKGEYFDHVLHSTVNYQATRSSLGMTIMFLAGLVSGLLGIGSGVLKVVALDIGMKLPMKVSSATSNFMIGVTAAASTGIFYLSGYINPFIVAPVAMGVAIGSVFGTKALMELQNASVRKIFVPVIIVLAVEMLGRGIGLA